MVDSKRMEELSISYLRALCAYEGIDYEHITHDDDSVDCEIKKTVTRSDGVEFKSSLHIQLKSTSVAPRIVGNTYAYDLKAKNYNDLVLPSTTPHILCVLFMPDRKELWITQNIDELILRKNMYWASLFGLSESSNTSAVTVYLPQSNCVSAECLNALLLKIAEEGRV